MLFTFVFAALAQRNDMKYQGLLAIGASAPKKDTDTDICKPVFHAPGTHRYFLIVASILVCVAGLRYYVGTDYGAYYRYADRYAERLWEALETFDEPGYPLIASISRIFTEDHALPIFIASLFTIGGALWVIYRYSDQLFFTTSLFLLICWTSTFNAVRQCLAMTCIFIGYPYFKNRKLVSYAICVVCAYLCHKSAIVMLLPFLLTKMRMNFRNILLFIIGCIIFLNSYDLIFSLTEDVLGDAQGTILDSSIEYYRRSVNVFRVATQIVPAVFFFWVLHYKSKKDFDEKTNSNLYILVLHASIALSAMNSPYLSRFYIFTIPFTIMAMGDLFKLFSVKVRGQMVIGTIVLYAIFFMYENSNSYALCDFHYVWER